MKNYAKLGNYKGKTAYRTPSRYRIQQSLQACSNKIKANNKTKKKYAPEAN